MSERHAVISPSKLHRIVKCPGSVVLCKPYEGKPPRPSAAEGTAGHWVAWVNALVNMGKMEAALKVGDKTPNGLAIDQDMLDGADLYVEALEDFDGTAETWVDIPRIHAECGGTPDFWQWNPVTKILRVTDYKYGRRYVEVFEIEQLCAYAAGLMDQLGLHDQDVIVELMIVQPRCYHPDGPVRTWRASAALLRAVINQCASAAEEALGPNPRTKTGPHCIDCEAAADCKTLHIAGQAVLEFAGSVEAMSCTADEVGVRLAQINEGLDILRALRDGLEEQALSMIRTGKNVTNWGTGTTKPREIWNAPISTIKGIGLMYGVPLTEEVAAMTPKQAIKRKIPETVIRKVSMIPTGTIKLIADDTKRTRKIFQK
jgi:hypothetical protein